MSIKDQLLKAVSSAYDAAYGVDKKVQANKPEFMKHVDDHIDKVLRPLFT